MALQTFAQEALWRAQVRSAINSTGISALNYIPGQYHAGISDGTITTNLTSYLQAAIDALPDAGGLVQLPAGRLPCAGLRLDGTGGGRSNVWLRGQGSATNLRKPDDSALTTAADRKSNVIYALGGSGFGLCTLMVEGNRARGGVAPPFGTAWQTNHVYSAGTIGTVVTTKANGTVVTPGDPASVSRANGGRVFLIASAHTSDVTDIDVDLAAGRVTEVTSQPWNDLTETGYEGYYDTDQDYANRHGVYLHGQSAAIEDVSLYNVEVTDSVYGGIVLGSGPLFSPLNGVGALRATTINCYSHDNGGSNFGGGFNKFGTHVCPRSTGGHSSGIRLDSDSDDSVLIRPLVQDGTNLDNGGILVYQSDRCKILWPVIRDTSLAIWLVTAADLELVGPDVDGDTISISGGGFATTGINTIDSISGDLILQAEGIKQATVEANASATEWLVLKGGATTVSGSPAIIARGAGTDIHMRLVPKGTGGVIVSASGGKVGFYGTTSPATVQTITGSRGGNAALADLLTKLALTGLIVDSTS